MKQEKFIVLKEMLDNKQLTVDLDTGDVYGVKGANLSKRKPKPSGYIQVILTHNGKKYTFYIHQIVAVAGGLDLVDVTVNHKNGNKQDNRLENLEAVSLSDNMKHAYKHGLNVNIDKGKLTPPPPPRFGEENGYSKLTTQQVVQIKHKLARGVMLETLAFEYGVSKTTINSIKRGKTWSHVQIPESVIQVLEAEARENRPKKWNVTWVGGMVR